MEYHQSIERLGPELLLLICEELYSITPKSLFSLRSTCHKIKQIATPFIYRTIMLRADIIRSSLEPKFEDTVRMIHSHVRHVEIKYVLDWDLVAGLLLKCRRLKTLRWNCNCNRMYPHFPESLRAVLKTLPHVGLCIDNYRYPRCASPQAALHTMSIPAASLVSFTAYTMRNVAIVELLQDLLVASRRLDRLIFKVRPQSFNAERGKFPAIRRLVLSSGDNWLYTPEDTLKIWDFSRLEELEISWNIAAPFLESVPLQELSGLKRLEIDNSCWSCYWHLQPGLREPYTADITRLLGTLLSHCHRLETLDIKCELNPIDISLISNQRDSLQVLRLFDVVSFETEGHVPTLSLTHLEMLQSSCARLSTLALGINRNGEERLAFTDILNRFRNVHDLTLYVQSGLYEETADTIVEDIGKQAAVELMNTLIKGKFGKPYSRLVINVGGWAEVGTRGLIRFGPNWTRRSIGVTPERLFVFEANCGGSSWFREEMQEGQRPWPNSC